MQLYNLSISGATCINSKPERSYLLDSINDASPSKTPSIITVMIGTNDYYNFNSSLGTPSSEESENVYYSQLNKAIKRIRERWTNSKIIIISPIPCYTSRSVSLNDFRDACKYIALINNVSYIDGRNLGIPDEHNSYVEDLLLKDTVHPTSLGHKTIGDALAGIIS